MSKTDKIKEALASSRLSGKSWTNADMLSTGSSLLNLALTNTINGGFLKGTYNLFVGDTNSGKTWICMTCLAEASINPEFVDYRFLFINRERGALMDIERFFGKEVAKRIEFLTDIETVEQMYFALDDALGGKKKAEVKPFICIVDSIDALTSEYEGKKFEERKRADRGGPKAAGDYGDGKAKIHSANIRRILSGLERTGSILIYINQSRDNVNASMFESKKTHSGGRAISFYPTAKIWSSVRKHITRTYKDKDREIGIISNIKVNRTRITGRETSIVVPIYHSVGMDDIGSCVDYLVDEKYWKKNDGIINTEDDFNISVTREKLIKHIEDNDFEFDLKQLVSKVWKDIIKAVAVVRKPKY